MVNFLFLCVFTFLLSVVVLYVLGYIEITTKDPEMTAIEQEFDAVVIRMEKAAARRRRHL